METDKSQAERGERREARGREREREGVAKGYLHYFSRMSWAGHSGFVETESSRR